MNCADAIRLLQAFAAAGMDTRTSKANVWIEKKALEIGLESSPCTNATINCCPPHHLRNTAKQGDESPPLHWLSSCRGLRRASEEYHVLKSRIVPYGTPKRAAAHVRFGSKADIVRYQPLVMIGRTRFKGKGAKMSRPPLPPFTIESAAQKVRMAEDAWNTRIPVVLRLRTRWTASGEIDRNSFRAAAAIETFLTRKWSRELDYRLIKEVWAFRENRIAVRFAYEWHDDSGNWFRSYGNENWEFDEQGLMRRRIASINDLPIKETERKYHWPLGRRPDDHPSLSEFGL